MKRHVILFLSLAANAVLIFIVLRPGGGRTRAVAHSEPAPAVAPAEKISVTTKPAVVDVAQWIRQSRSAGIPDAVLAELAVADFNTRWAARQREFERRYWRGYENNASRLRFDQQHDAELEQALRATVGDDAFVAWDKRCVLGAFNSDRLKLAPDEENSFYQLAKDWNRLGAELQRRQTAGEIDEAQFTQQFAAAAADYEARCQALLGDERFAALRQPMDSANVELRRRLGPLAISDDAFDALAQASRELDTRRNELNESLSSGKIQRDQYTEQLRAAEAAKDDAFRQALGADAFAEFQRQQDSRYETLKHYAAEWQLSAGDVEYLYRLTHDYAQSVQDYRARAQRVEEQGQAVDWPAVQQNLRGFSQRTEEALRLYLGDEHLGKLKESGVFAPDN